MLSLKSFLRSNHSHGCTFLHILQTRRTTIIASFLHSPLCLWLQPGLGWLFAAVGAWDVLRGEHIAGLAFWLVRVSPHSCNAGLLLNHFLAACTKKPITSPVSRMGCGISGIPGWASRVLQHTLTCFCVEGIYFILSSRHMVFLITTCKQIQAELIPRSAGYFCRLISSLASCRAGHRTGHLNLQQIKQRQNWSRLARKRLGSSSLLCPCRSVLTGVQDVITVSRRLQLMRSLSSQLLFFIACQHRADKPCLDIFELALSEADSVFYCVPALGSEAGRDHSTSYLG